MNNLKNKILYPLCLLMFLPSSAMAADWRVNTFLGEVNSEDSLEGFFIMILNAIYGLVGIITVIRIIIGGYRYMSAAGNPAEAKRAKETILHALQGLGIVLLAYLLTSYVMKTFGNDSTTNNT